MHIIMLQISAVSTNFAMYNLRPQSIIYDCQLTHMYENINSCSKAVQLQTGQNALQPLETQTTRLLHQCINTNQVSRTF